MLQGSFNTRALLGLDGQPWLYRSANLDQISAEDDALLGEMGVTQVIDLRSKIERGPVVHHKKLQNLPLYGEDNVPPQFDGIDTTYGNLINTVGEKFAQAATFVAEESGRTLIHCLIGKDRTGLVVGLLLSTVGVSDEEIFYDYSLSEIEVKKHTQDMILDRFNSMENISEEQRKLAIELHLASPAKALETIFHNVRKNYGSIREYLQTYGATDEVFDKLETKYSGAKVEVS